MSSLADRALQFAARAHEGQVRKYTGEPYIGHPVAVAKLVREAGFDDEVIAAAYLHDVVEDCGITPAQIEEDFSVRVRRLVGEVTDVSRPEDGNRKTRKALDRDHLATASPEGKSIKLADIIDNTVSIIERDPKFAVVYLREKALLLPVLADGNAALWQRASRQVADYHNTRAG